MAEDETPAEQPASEQIAIDDEPLEGNEGPSAVVLFALIGAALVAVVGAVGYVSGSGWFGYRQIMYGTGELYLGNYLAEKRLVSVDGRDPVELGPNKYETVELIGGTSSLRVMNADRETLSRHSITIDASDAYFKVAGEPCLVASDVTSFYGGSGEIAFVEFIRSDQRTYVLGTHNTIWPGRDFPETLQSGDGPGVWLEKVGCPLLEDEPVLRRYLEVRLRDRMGPDEPTRMGPPGEVE